MGETGELMSRSLKLVTLLLCATLAVSACGKRGALEPPGSDDGTSVSGGKKKHAGDPKDKKDKEGYVHSKADEDPSQHRPFILDGLLR